jgi:hypothetical protein
LALCGMNLVEVFHPYGGSQDTVSPSRLSRAL